MPSASYQQQRRCNFSEINGVENPGYPICQDWTNAATTTSERPIYREQLLMGGGAGWAVVLCIV